MMSSSKSSSEISSSSLLQDKTILVTGANRGIGRALVKCFVEHGAKKVYAAVRNLDSIKNDKTFGINDTQSDDSNNRRIIPLYLDLTKRDSILEASKIATDVNVVINNGGVLTNTSVMSSNCIDNLQYEMNVNVYGLIHMTQIFLPILQKQNSTKNNTNTNTNDAASHSSYFVQINSVASMRCGIPDVATYSASKSASYSLTQAIRQECTCENSTNYSNVKVISVHPGPIATDMIMNASKELAKQAEDPYNVALDVLKAITSKETPFLVFPDPKSKTMGELYLHGTSTSSKASNNNTDGNKKRKKRDDDKEDDDEDESDDGSGDGSNSGGSGGGFGQTVIIEGKMYG